MGYEQALAAAGADVIAFESFGSYQGDWWALVEYQGERFWVHGCYGSCSGCDAFQSEFDYDSDKCEEHRYEWDDVEGCLDCDLVARGRDERLAEFGRRYPDNPYTTEQALHEAEENIDWDLDAREMADFIRRFL